MSGRARPDQREILRHTSRTFAFSITALPRAMRTPVEVAYLLARAADTIADTDLAGGTSRRALLAELRGAVVEGGEGPARPIAELAQGAGASGPTARAEGELLGRVGSLLRRYRNLPEADRRDVRDVVARLIQTMEGELAWAEAGAPLAVMADAAALTRYTEGIAGCVGAFWTRLVARHRVRLTPQRLAALEAEGRRYGRGLQLINILRDLPRDLRRGRCFLPGDELAAAGIDPRDLLDPGRAGWVAPVLQRWERRACRGVMAGLAYTTRLPLRGWPLRVATCLPAAIGAATLSCLAESTARLDPDTVIRVDRRQLRILLLRSGLAALTPRGPRKLAGQPAGR